MLRRALLAMVFCVGLVVAGAGIQAPVQAQEVNPNGYKFSREEVNAYEEATQDCSTPSLECLARNTTRFVAIEWLNDIVGQPLQYSNEPAPTGSLNSPTPVAQRGGAINALSSLISGMYAYPVAKTSRYVADVMDNAGIASPAYAQGLGFASLDPILSLWKTFRNVAYFFFIAIIIIIGIMIMLRQKISAQASVTAQQALPSIIISLILVTFSYAIVGLMIDVMYLSMFLIVGLFDTISKGNTLGTDMISMNIFQFGGMIFKETWGNTGTNMNLVTSVISSLTPSGNTNALTGFLGFVGGLTLSLILAVAVLVGLFKLFFELLKSYAAIILGVVFAPIYLMMGAIPGKNAFTPWFKNLVGNLAAFPTTLLFAIIYQIFTVSLAENNSGGFMPPYLIGNGQSGIAGYVIGLGILLALPDIVKDVKKKMGAAEGGFGAMIASAADRNLSSGVRFAPWMAGTAASVYGAGEGLVRAAGNGRTITSPRATLKQMDLYRKARGAQIAEPVRSFARGYEQWREGKAIDPNSWENALIATAKEKRTAEIEARRKAMAEGITPTTTG